MQKIAFCCEHKFFLKLFFYFLLICLFTILAINKNAFAVCIQDSDGGQCVEYVRNYFGGSYILMPGLCAYSPDCGARNAWGNWDLGFGSGQIPADNSIMVIDQFSGIPTGHVAVVISSNNNTDGTYTLNIQESNWGPGELVDCNITYIFYPTVSEVIRESGPTRYPILGFIYGELQSPQDKSLARIEGQSEVYWLQNTKAYHVLSNQIIQDMSELPGWNTTCEYPADILEIIPPGHLQPEGTFLQGPDFISTGPESNGLLIKLAGSLPVFLVEDGILKWIPESIFNEQGYDWNDIITVTPKILGLFTKVDLVFVIDTTGSMWDDIAAAKAAAVDIVNEIDAQTNDYRVAVVSFEDFPYSPYGSSSCGDYMYHDVLNFPPLPFSSDKSTVVSAIQGLTLRCGADWRESHYSALMHCFQKDNLGGWRNGVKKVAILMTDAPPHDPEPFTGYVAQDVIDAAIALDPVVIYPISIGHDSTTRAYMNALAEGTGGTVFGATNASQVVEAIIAAIEATFNAPIADVNGPYIGIAGSPITFNASGSYDPDGTIVSYEWDFDNNGTYDETTITPTPTYAYTAEYIGLVKLRVTDNDGLTGIDTASVEVIGNQPPIANAGSDQTVAVGPDCMATVTLDGSSSSDPDGDPLTYSWTWDGSSVTGVTPTIQLPLGTTTITLVVNDGTVDSGPDTVEITTIDNIPPEITLSVSPDTLWPPNHKMVLITPTITVADNCDSNPVINLQSITMNEGEESNTYDPNYDSTVGDGHTLGDIQVDVNGDIYLRAERSGTGTGRVYTIVYTATDASGNNASASATVTVPHSQ